jgi:indole-3-glycerol phosphate synthase/phosphoribosylanthranilate isomerase
MTYLDEILARKREEVREAKTRVPLEALRDQLAGAPRVRNLSLRGTGVIAEVKRASPSAGAIAPGADAVAQAKRYAAAGAAAISVLTDGPGFGGSLDDLRAVRAAVDVPVLRKDFVVDEYQLFEARAAGADLILLIAAALDDESMVRCLDLAAALDLGALVEVHDESELQRVQGAALIGINNRNLRTFQVDLATSERLLPLLRRTQTGVVESGIRTPADARRLGRAGAAGFLVGEALMRAEDPGALLRDLRGAAATSFQVKICGITTPEDAEAAVRAGADAIGLNFWPESKRRVSLDQAARIAAVVPSRVRLAGVFVNADLRTIEHALATVPLSAIQLHGDEPPELSAQIPAAVIRSIPISAATAFDRARQYPAAAFLLDAPAKGYGGAGEPFDWSLAGSARDRLQRPIVLAGGLTPENVAEAIRRVRPDGVDVASGVESAPGRKDPERLRKFVVAAREALTP